MFFGIWVFVLVGLMGAGMDLGAAANSETEKSELDKREERRDLWLQPEEVLKVMAVKPGMVIGEAGAGKGYFTFKLARKVGCSGKIYANDINEESLDILKRRAKEKKLENIVVIKGDVVDSRFPVGQLDMVFMCYAIHDFTEPVQFLRNLKPVFKSNGLLVILDQDPEKTDDRGHFWEKEKMLRTVRKAGYRLVKIEIFLVKDNIYFFKPR